MNSDTLLYSEAAQSQDGVLILLTLLVAIVGIVAFKVFLGRTHSRKNTAESHSSSISPELLEAIDKYEKRALVYCIGKYADELEGANRTQVSEWLKKRYGSVLANPVLNPKLLATREVYQQILRERNLPDKLDFPPLDSLEEKLYKLAEGKARQIVSDAQKEINH